MVKSIHIQNFRCFEDFQLEGFGRVNLIGGMNNSGKTVLANKFNVQVFATTHSKEMVQAFNKVALEEGFEEDAKYIEMARNYKT